MKGHFSIVILFMAAFMSAYAQNVQLHYDLGKSLYNDLSNRESVTSTVEMFKPDKFGSTYMFIDFDYVSDGTIGAYWEISRELNVSKDKHWAAHVEYNGGVSTGETPAGYYGNRFQHAALVGPAWNIHSKDFNRTLGIQLMYKYYFANHHSDARAFNSVQLTEAWGINFAQGLCTFRFVVQPVRKWQVDIALRASVLGEPQQAEGHERHPSLCGFGVRSVQQLRVERPWRQQ